MSAFMKSFNIIIELKVMTSILLVAPIRSTLESGRPTDFRTLITCGQRGLAQACPESTASKPVHNLHSPKCPRKMSYSCRVSRVR